jgi:Mn2+/Fe2+ NRAMP family transporter
MSLSLKPLRARKGKLVRAAVVNGVVAVPIMVAMMLVVSGGKGLRSLSLPRWLTLLGWIAAALMALTVVLLVWSSFA